MGKLVHSLASLFRRQQSPCLIHDVFPLPHVLYQLAKKKKKKRRTSPQDILSPVPAVPLLEK